MQRDPQRIDSDTDSNATVDTCSSTCGCFGTGMHPLPPPPPPPEEKKEWTPEPRKRRRAAIKAEEKIKVCVSLDRHAR
jgi:hypothetical protein